ncbi:MAG TPA: hypothetical protein VIF57_26435 [Polyangia bacterium]|jgi:hypothetical protein
MFTLLKFGAGIVALLAFAWFGMTFKLGERTLFEHLHAIGQTKESQELVDGTRQAVRHRVVDSDKGDRPPSVGRDAGAPLERLSSSEQRQLRYLLDKATKATQ